MPRHQKKQPPIHTDSHPDSTADAPSKLVKKKAGMLEALGSSLGMPAGRGSYLFHCGSFGNEMGEPPHICLSELIIASVYPSSMRLWVLRLRSGL